LAQNTVLRGAKIFSGEAAAPLPPTSRASGEAAAPLPPTSRAYAPSHFLNFICNLFLNGVVVNA